MQSNHSVLDISASVPAHLQHHPGVFLNRAGRLTLVFSITCFASACATTVETVPVSSPSPSSSGHAALSQAAPTAPTVTTDGNSQAPAADAQKVPKILPWWITAGSDHTCVMGQGGVTCWGKPYEDQLALKRAAPASDLCAAADYTCALLNGQIECRGDLPFDPLVFAADPQAIYCGDRILCAVYEGGLMQCEGVGALPPAQFEVGTTLTLGGDHGCTLSLNGMYCFGDPDGDFDQTYYAFPALGVDAGFRHTCLFSAQEVRCLGLNTQGQSDPPLWLNSGTYQILSVATGTEHTCVLYTELETTTNRVTCFGDNDFHQLQVPDLQQPYAVAAGAWHTCALTLTGPVCWGDNFFGQLKVPTSLQEETP